MRKRNPTIISYEDIILLCTYYGLSLEYHHGMFKSPRENRIDLVVFKTIQAYLHEVELTSNISDKLRFETNIRIHKKPFFEALALLLEKPVLIELGLFKYFDEGKFNRVIRKIAKEKNLNTLISDAQSFEKIQFFIERTAKNIANDLYGLVLKIKK